MDVIRLPGIHHDTSVTILTDDYEAILIDTGTSWHQVNTEERIRSKIQHGNLDTILLTHRHYDTAGAAAHLANVFDATIYTHGNALNSLASNDQLTTWASRFDSDMPPTSAHAIENGWRRSIGGLEIEAIHTPGHTSCHTSFLLKELGILVAGDLFPAATTPGRTDLPTGNVVQMKDSIQQVRDLDVDTLIPSRGETIRGNAIEESLTRHLDFFDSMIDAKGVLPKEWPIPVPTCMWWTPEPEW
ncbi:MAG: MBL fold metallo-hydrolase [Candidatus Thermoplasmatota archaeon]|nr:MBL fold metallo-hydrolase [Candidatus Thermoplasmatota archaeon]